MVDNKPQCIRVKETASGEGSLFNWCASGMQGWRPKMEDAHLIKPDFEEKRSLIAVFDGHGGPAIAKFCEKYFLGELQANENYKQGNFKDALTETCLKMDELILKPAGLQETYELNGGDGKVDWESLNEEEMREKRPDAGCTAIIALFVDKHVIIANVGDSRAVLCENGISRGLSVDQKPENNSEANRVQQAGGIIIHGRVNFKLTLTRAIGDVCYKQNKDNDQRNQVIIAVPEFQEFDLDSSKHPFMILGCDGIWEQNNSNAKNVNTVKTALEQGCSLNQICESQILDKLCARTSEPNDGCGTDNMSVVILQFKQ